MKYFSLLILYFSILYSHEDGAKIYWNSLSTDVTIDVPIADDESLEGGRIQVKVSFDAGNTFNNLGDELYIILSESLQFSFPGITIPKPTSSLIPDFIKDRFPFEVMPTFSVGLGDDSSRAVARSRINANNSSTAERVSTRDSETAAALQAVQAIASELGKNFQQVVINNIDNSNTDNSNSSTTTAVATGNNNDGFALVQ